ncbi:Uncharacterised protein [Halioglobus japonicus]|nr:Uncharacterised protein [Halioglobus japonicus]
MSLAVGDFIPEWVMESVTPERMCTMAAILRDPNPIHWDRDAVDALPLGLGKRTINQGPLGLSYIINMLHAWAGPNALRRIVMRFPQVVLDQERVVAKGNISALREEHGITLADCTVWLEHAERGVLLEGIATVVFPPPKMPELESNFETAALKEHE